MNTMPICSLHDNEPMVLSPDGLYYYCQVCSTKILSDETAPKEFSSARPCVVTVWAAERADRVYESLESVGDLGEGIRDASRIAKALQKAFDAGYFTGKHDAKAEAVRAKE